MEVDVPVLADTGVTDLHIESYTVVDGGRSLYLQTSPEYYMKRLLAAGSGDIYYLGKAFRREELGRRHLPEFTMLEWYRLGFNEQDLIAEVVALLEDLSGTDTFEVNKVSYRECFAAKTGVNPHAASMQELADLARREIDVSFEPASKSDYLDLIFSHLVEPSFSSDLFIVYDYPACQSALARISGNEYGDSVAKRFEVFWRGLELANGYWELTDPQEQRVRFNRDVMLRKQQGKKELPIDEKLLAALESGLPECAGVALGIDRLLMCISGIKEIDGVVTFAGER